MNFRIQTEVTITPVDPEEECLPADLERVGTHQVEFSCHCDDSVVVHATALETLNRDVWIQYPDQFRFEVAFPEGANIEELRRSGI